MLHQQLEQAASFCLLVNDRRSYNHVQGDDMRDSNPTFSCYLARVAIPCQVQQPGTAPPSGSKTIVLSSPFSSTSNRRTALKLGSTDLRGLRNTLVQKKLEIYLRQKSGF